MLFHVFTFFWCYGDILVLVRLFCRATTSLLTVRDVSMRAGNLFNIVTIAITAAILITIFIAIMIIILTIQGRFAPWVVPRVWRDAHTEEAGPRQVMIIRRMVMVVIMLGEKPRNVSTDRASDKGKRMKGYTFCCETLTRNHLHPKLNSHQRRAKLYCESNLNVLLSPEEMYNVHCTWTIWTIWTCIHGSKHKMDEIDYYGQFPKDIV